jgi:2-phospho-L-lactate guanylyltransferase (CobY/MobA/RfbA family)
MRMISLLIPIAPLSRTKSRLRDCFSIEQLKDLTISMFKDLAEKIVPLNFFDHKIVYCNSNEILEITRDYGLIAIKEKLTTPRKSFDDVIKTLNNLAIRNFNTNSTIFTFLDIILISIQNLHEIALLLKKNELVICPAIHSAGISVLGRNPPNVIPTYFSDPNIPSLLAILNEANKRNLKLTLYDSFRAGFDIDIKQDLVLAYEYLKIFHLTDTYTYKFLKNNLKLSIQKKSVTDNRNFEIKSFDFVSDEPKKRM